MVGEHWLPGRSARRATALLACAVVTALGAGEVCPLDCPAGAVREIEPCGADTNGGCNLEPPAFERIEPDTLVCGTGWFDVGVPARDTDWYLVSVDDGDGNGTALICATLTSEIPSCIFVVDISDCRNPVVVGAPAQGGCRPGTASACVEAPGDYAVFVGHGPCEAPFVDNLCGGANDYLLCVSVSETCAGACPPCPTDAPCPWDLDADERVATSDLLALLAAWGPNPGHPADFDGDGFVATSDLTALLASWGAC